MSWRHDFRSFQERLVGRRLSTVVWTSVYCSHVLMVHWQETATFPRACGTHLMSKRSTVRTGLQLPMPVRRICWKQNSGGTSTKAHHLLIKESPATAGLFLCLVLPNRCPIVEDRCSCRNNSVWKCWMPRRGCILGYHPGSETTAAQTPTWWTRFAFGRRKQSGSSP